MKGHLSASLPRAAAAALTILTLCSTAAQAQAPGAGPDASARPVQSVTTSIEYLSAQDEFHLSGIDLASLYLRYERRLARLGLGRIALGGEAGLHWTSGPVQYFGDPQVYHTDTVGFSTSGFARVYALDNPRFDIFAEGMAGFIKFGEPFPPNGTVINGLLRYGAGVRIGMSSRLSVEAGYRHAHISNGMGLVALNPSFDGNGAFAAFSLRF